MRLDFPSVYFLFYEYFFKSSVGDIRWKRTCTTEQDKSTPLGSPQAEAFAMLLLKNNYFAWLLDAKLEAKGKLMTDYDPPIFRAGKKSAAELYLKKLEINVDGGDSDNILVAEGHMQYSNLRKKTDELLQSTRRMAKNNATYKEVKKAMDDIVHEAIMAGETEENGEDGMIDDEFKKREQLKKKRKILKPFREYTVRQAEEGRFKGWSKRAATDMAALCKQIKDEKNNGGKFRTAYREIYLLRHHQQKPKANEPEEEPVDYSELWDVENIIPVEI